MAKCSVAMMYSRPVFCLLYAVILTKIAVQTGVNAILCTIQRPFTGA